MKTIAFIVLALFVQSVSAVAQAGLERVIVEKYYITDSSDSISCKNQVACTIPLHAVTYRIYIDLMPGYRFQAAFGIPGHPMFIKTTTTFYNTPDYGATVSNAIPDRLLGEQLVMIDSWLSVGGASEGTYGILKSEDDTVSTIKNLDNRLQNENPYAGIPLKYKDGLQNGHAHLVTGFNIDTIIEVFKNKSNGNIFYTDNGSWACMGGSVGLDSIDNKILIAQITTDGDLEFELNLQIGKPDGGFQRFVAKNPGDQEILFPGLRYRSIADPELFKFYKKIKKIKIKKHEKI
ncbi:MAG: hypothetical protein ACK5CD_11295 [Bacteroidota bacterium]|jgi:hypothetical protein